MPKKVQFHLKTKFCSLLYGKKKTSIIVAVVLFIVAISSIVGISALNNNKKYEELTVLMASIDTRLDLSSAGQLISELPNHFKDVKSIAKEYKTLRNLDLDLYNISRTASSSSKSSDNARSIYEELYRFDINNPDWDLEGLREYYLDECRIDFVYGKKWTCPLRPDGSGSLQRIYLWNEEGKYTRSVGSPNIYKSEVYYQNGKWTLILDSGTETFVMN